VRQGQRTFIHLGTALGTISKLLRSPRYLKKK
jgi:hypothetical protein